MGDRPIQPVIQSITIDTMLNSNGLNIGDGLNVVTCGRSFKHGRSESGLKCILVRVVFKAHAHPPNKDANEKNFFVVFSSAIFP